MQNWLEQVSELLKKDQTHILALEALLEEKIPELVSLSFSNILKQKYADKKSSFRTFLKKRLFFIKKVAFIFSFLRNFICLIHVLCYINL